MDLFYWLLEKLGPSTPKIQREAYKPIDELEGKIYKRIRFYGKYLGDRVKPEHTLVKDLGYNSINFVNLILELEEDFDILILEKDAQDLTSVKDIVDYIRSRVNVETTESGRQIITPKRNHSV